MTIPRKPKVCPRCGQSIRSTSRTVTPTRRESNVLTFIRRFIGRRGQAPTYQEIAEGIGVTSRVVIHHHVAALVSKGWITIEPRKKRAIRIIDRGIVRP